MFIKTNQGLGRTNRNKKKKRQNNETKTRPNQTKKEKKKKKKGHTSKDLCTDINDSLREPKENSQHSISSLL